MRNSAGIYVSMRRRDCDGSGAVALVSDSDLLQDSLALARVLSASSDAPALCGRTGILFAGVRPVDSVALRSVIRVMARAFFCPSRVIGGPEHDDGEFQGLWARAALSFVRLLLRTVSLCRGVSFTQVCTSHQDATSRRSLARISRRAYLVSRALEGRLLTFSELSTCLTAAGETRDPVATRMAVDALSILGCLEMFPGILRRWTGRTRCCRCGSESEILYMDRCEKCGARCAMCVCCSSLGLVTSCTWLLHVPAGRGHADSAHRSREQHAVALSIPFQLTRAQRIASRRVQDFVEETGSREFLVWAVCGAGKTEVVCSAIASALNKGGTVLYVIPRQSAAGDIHTRLCALFRGTRVGLQSGQKRVGNHGSRFTVCTAHQTLRFRHFADLVVFDEVDAYPCTPGGFLERAVKRSLHPHGKIVYLTATPDAALFEKARKGLLRFCLISSRHHGKPVPVPRVLSIGSAATHTKPRLGPQGTCTDGERCLLEVVHDHRHQGQVRAVALAGCLRQVVGKTAWPFRRQELCLLCAAALDPAPTIVFVPTIRLVEQARDLLNSRSEDCWPGVRWGFCHSKLSDCGDTLRELKGGRITSIVATTVLERGITVSGVNVVVMRADSDVFSARSLVQMAGRAGRTSDCPTGRVVFAVDEATREVKTAMKMIQFMNDRLIH